MTERLIVPTNYVKISRRDENELNPFPKICVNQASHRLFFREDVCPVPQATHFRQTDNNYDKYTKDEMLLLFLSLGLSMPT